MWEWLVENKGTILVVIILAVVVFLVIRSIIRDKKQGKSSCGGSCGSCPMGGSCHKQAAGKKKS